MSLSDSFPQMIRRDVPLSMYTRLQLGGAAEFFAAPSSEEDLAALLKACKAENAPIHILGNGSSLLVPEAGVEGVVISLAHPSFTHIAADDLSITAGSGAQLSQVVTHAVSVGLGGIEAFVGMPSSFGGAICGNIRTTHDGDIGQWVESVRLIDFGGTITEFHRHELTFGYRRSSIENAVLLSATLTLEKDDPKELAKRMRKLWIIRKSQQPGGEAVSVLAFKNPETGASASELIEQVGLRGTRIGGAMVSERNTAFITIADNDCISDDVVRLIRLVQEQVAHHMDVELEPALEIW